MENYSYTTAYPESDSSPRSRDIDFENPPSPWEDNSNNSNNNYRVKFMCSYGGKISPRPHDNHLSYVGGETKILAVDRTVKFSGLIAKISALCEADICFKYQLPGEDLDALISVTNDDDLQHMMHEYDRLNRVSTKPARLRLFLFPVSGSTASFSTPAQSFGSNASEGRSEREKFVEALNSGPVQSPEMAAATTVNNNVDFLFGLEKGMPPPAKHEPITDPVVHQPEVRVPAMYMRKAEENFTGEYYGQQKSTENVPPPTLPGQVNGYWPEKQIHGGVYTPATTMMSDQQMYMIQTPSNIYHAAPMAARPPVTGPVGQGYYAVQRMPPPPTEFYREQPVYTQQQQQQLQSATTQPTLQQQQLPAGYSQVAAYDGGAVGRQLYYTAQGGVVVAQPQPPTAAQYQAAMAAGNFNHDGGTVVPAKVTQAAV